MQKTIISWATDTWNPFGGCSRVSDGCKFCYAELLSLRYGHTKSAWTLQNEAENVTMKPHKLAEPFALKESSRVFVNSMSDMFHRMIPDWYRAAVFNVMLSLPQHVFQILTKRPEATVDWHTRYLEAVKTPEYRQLAETHKSPKVRAALNVTHETPWGDNLWMGTSVEDSRVVKRIDYLRQCGAKTRFLSCEPLIGPLGDVDLSGIAWVICGGESGNHLTDASHPRWMKQEWARELRDNCVAQGVAFFYKQDSGKVTEQRPYLVEADGTFWRWWQYPGDLAKAVQVDAKGEPLPVSVVAKSETTEPTFDTGMMYDQPQSDTDTDPTIGHAYSPDPSKPNQYAFEQVGKLTLLHDQYVRLKKESPHILTLLHIGNYYETFDGDAETVRRLCGLSGNQYVKQNISHVGFRCDTLEKHVTTLKADGHIVRVVNANDERNKFYFPDAAGVEPKPAAQSAVEPKPTRVVSFHDVKAHWNAETQQWDSAEYVYIGRKNAFYSIPESKWHNPFTAGGSVSPIELFRKHINNSPKLLAAIEELHGKTLVCWCKSEKKPNTPCHGDVLLDLLGVTQAVSETPKVEAAVEPKPEAVQLKMF